MTDSMKDWWRARARVAGVAIVSAVAGALVASLWFFALRWFGIDPGFAALFAIWQGGRTDAKAERALERES